MTSLELLGGLPPSISRRRAATWLGTAALGPALQACAAPRSPPEGLAEGEQRAWTLPQPAGVAEGRSSGYSRLWLWLPRGYGRQPEPWPLLVFLHGSGERGHDLQAVARHGPPLLAERGLQDYPLILASPQLEPGARWDPQRLQALVAALQQRLHIDARRVLATGLSLGGHGVWHWASAHPQALAAIAPVCGYGDPAAVPAMRAVPVRAYHGDADTVVPLARQQACVEALRAAGGQVSLTVYPGVGHDAWTPAYRDAQLLPWLLARRRT